MNFLQRSMIVEVLPKVEDCFFIDGVAPGHKINIHWNVSYPLDLPMRNISCRTARVWKFCGRQYRFRTSVPNAGKHFETSDFRQVLNTGGQGQSLDITMYVRDPLKNLMTYAARETEGKKIGLMAERFGDYEVCFSNRFDDYNPGVFFWTIFRQFNSTGVADFWGFFGILAWVFSRFCLSFEFSGWKSLTFWWVQ